METTTLWSGPRKQCFSPTLNAMNSTFSPSGTRSTPVTGNNELAGVRSPPCQLPSPLSTPQLTSRTARLINVRPCVAGTQTLQHQTKQVIKTTGKYDQGTENSLNDLTQDSSGFGSLLIGDSPTPTSVLSAGTPSTDRPAQWKESNRISLETDTSDLCVDHSSGSLQSPVSRYQATGIESNANCATLIRTPSQKDNLPETEHDRAYNEASSAFHLVSGRQSRMLEENLASVARYVEELTGCSSGKSDLLSVEKTVSPQATTQRNLMGTVRSQQNHLSSRAQLQLLNEQLAALKAERSHDKGAQGTGGQEQLLRLLANQYPDLVMPSNSLLETTSNSDLSNWTTNSGNPQLSRLTLDSFHKRPISHEYQSTSLESPRNGGYSTAASLLSTINDRFNDTELRRGTLIGLNTGDRRPQVEVTSNRFDDKPSFVSPTLMNNMPSTSQRNLSDYYSGGISEHINEQGALAALANLLGTGPLDCNGQSTQKNAVLNSLLATLHDRKPNISCAPVRELPKALTRSLSDPLGNEVCSTNIQQTSNCSLSEELLKLAAPYQRLLGALENDIDHAANVYRNSASTVAQKSEAAYHWSGRLPVRIYRSMTFSRKVFLGGVPWDSTSDDLIMAFSRFGNVTVSWPQQEGYNMSSMRGRTAAPKGYCYLIFDQESSVNELLAACVRDPTTGGDYYKISSSKFKAKDVQVIPWVISDSQYTKSGPYRPDSKRTVFIGALHGMITAEALVTIMNDLFGNVVFAALDTDKYKYPIGSGRVAFSSHKSYMRAVTANFVDVRTSKFVKTIQIDPYLEDSLCNSCFSSPGIYFCRAFECFRYFCPACWQLWHNTAETLYTHKPLRRTFKPVTDRTWSVMSKF